MRLRSGSEVHLIACGPSIDDILGREEEFDSVPIALVNRAAWKWEGRCDYYFSQHPEFFVRSDWVAKIRCKKPHRNQCFTIRRGANNFGVYTVLDDRLYVRGTSSLFAAENLVIRFGYERVHLWGVDLTRHREAMQFRYDLHREEWKPFIDEYGDLLVDHSRTQWIANRDFKEEQAWVADMREEEAKLEQAR